MRYTFKHVIETDADTYWNQVFFSAEFNRALFVDFIGFEVYEVVEERRDAGGVVHRRVECLPKIELPAAFRKLFGPSVRYTEIGRYDPAARRYFVEVIPQVGADYVRTISEIWAEPCGQRRCERAVMVDCSVRVPGLGALIERYLEQQTRAAYARGAEFTNRWIRERGL
jgi:hypothetical protein